MPRFTNRLKHVRVASPCKSDWDQMIGTDRVRFCGQCSLNVYNLSAMTRDEAESLIAANEGRLCVRFYRRGDGSIISQDCPVGLRAVRQRISSVTKAVASAALAILASLGMHNLLAAISPVRSSHVTMGMVAREDRIRTIVESPPDVEVGGLAVVGKWSNHRDPKPKSKR